MQFLSVVQVNSLAGAIHQRHRAVILLCAYGGLRAGEAWTLRIEHVHPSTSVVDIVGKASESGGFKVGPTKTGKKRAITVPRFLMDVLVEHIHPYPSRDGWVFTEAEGATIHRRNFRKRHHNPACAKVGFGILWREKRA